MRIIVNYRFICCLMASLYAMPLFFTAGSTASAGSSTLDDIIKHVEKRYAATAFSARFFQTSTLKAMGVSETASGRLLVKRPAMMRWEYETPERQLIISDGTRLWIYRPEDHQVMLGKAPSFFGEGKGAGFLSDIRRVRHNFEITLGEQHTNSKYLLKLVPKHKTNDIISIYLAISPKTFDVVEVITYNPYEDETRIRLSEYRYSDTLADSLFKFEIPPGVDVLRMDAQ